MEAAIAEATRVYNTHDLSSCNSGLGLRTEFELASMVASGRMDALEEIYRRHRRSVYGLCLRMTRNVAEAEDLTQDVFVHLYHALGSFRGDSALSTWIHRLTVNHVLMHFRKTVSRREQTTEDGGPPPEKVTGGLEASRRTPLDRVALEKAIGKLPSGYRTVLILHDVEGYEHAEVARMCGITAGTSKSQLHKARMRLRQLLNL